jgi:transposase
MLSVTTARDARSLAHDTLEEMRRLGVQRALAGETQVEIARSLGVHHDTVSKWVRAYRTEGAEGIASTKAGGRPPKLTNRQVDRLRRIILGKTPRQLNFGVNLWTVPVIADAIEKLFEVRLHETTVLRMLHRIGLTPQKPLRRAFNRDPEQIHAWTTSKFPAVVREARRKQATLLFLDETGVHEDGPIGTTWSVKGQTPIVATTGTRRRANVISAISPRGRLWFRCFRGTLTATRFIEFLLDLLADTSRPLVIVMDRHPAHVAASVKRFLLVNKKRISVHLLPGYAPELNPDEHVWAALKGMFRRDTIEADESFDGAVERAMQTIQEQPAWVKSFFRHPEVKYVREALKW